MKKFIAVIAVLCLMLTLCSCAAKGLDAKNLQLSELDSSVVNDAVQMFIKQKTVTDATEEVVLHIENPTQREFSFDAVARLEAMIDGHWYLLTPKSDAVTMQLFHLPAESVEEASFVLAGNYDKLPEGSYRIVKAFVDADGAMAYATSEFTIGRG